MVLLQKSYSLARRGPRNKGCPNSWHSGGSAKLPRRHQTSWLSVYGIRARKRARLTAVAS